MPYCPNCGLGPSEDRFCASCGTRMVLGGASGTPAPAQPPTVSVAVPTAVAVSAPPAAPGPAGASGPDPVRRRRSRRRTGWIVAAAAAAAVVVVAAVAGGVVVFGSGAAPSRMTTALSHVPGDATQVFYTDWTALGHPEPQAMPRGLAGGGAWANYDTLIAAHFGVRSTQADWEVDFFTAAGRCSVFQWPDASGPRGIAAGLAEAGWQQTSTGSRIRLTRASPDQDEDWGWASFAREFLVDTDSDVVVQCADGSELPRAAQDQRSGSFAGLPGVTGLVAATGTVTSAYLQTYADACQNRQHSAAVPFTVAAMSTRAGVTTAFDISAAYPSSGNAQAQRDPFAATVAANPQHRNPPGPGMPLAVSSVTVRGSVVVATVGTKQAWGTAVPDELSVISDLC